MEFKNQSHFLELKKKYAIEFSQAKQASPATFAQMDEDEHYASLLLLDYNAKAVEAANDYLDRNSEPEALCALCMTMVMSAYRLLDEIGDIYEEEDVRKIRNLMMNHQEIEHQLNNNGDSHV
jgi:hypothetical protein